MLSFLRISKRRMLVKERLLRRLYDQGHVFAIRKESLMLEKVALILLLLWAVGVVSSYTLSGLIHVLLVAVLLVLLLRLVRDMKAF